MNFEKDVIELLTQNGRSAVFEAAYLGAYKQVETLIEAGAKIDKCYPSMFNMCCIDGACFRKKYDVVFLLMKHGVSSATLRERHRYFIEAYPKDNIRLIDDRVEAIISFFDDYLPRRLSFSLAGQLSRDHGVDVGRYPGLLNSLVKEHYENIEQTYVVVK